MALINSIIPPQNYEVVRDQIALLLKAEITNQVLKSGNYEIDALVYIERTVPPNSGELDSGPLVNVLLDSGDYDDEDVTQTRGTYNYFIDVYTIAKTSAALPGDTRAKIKLERMMGIIRAILMSTQYLTLGFVPPFVMGRRVKMIAIKQPGEASADNLVMGRLVVEVQVPEGEQTGSGQLIGGADTTVKIDISPEGYMWVNDNY